MLLQSNKGLAPCQIYKPHLSKTSKHRIPAWIIKLTHAFLHCKKNVPRGSKSAIGEKKMSDKSWILDVLEFSKCVIEKSNPPSPLTTINKSLSKSSARYAHCVRRLINLIQRGEKATDTKKHIQLILDLSFPLVRWLLNGRLR